MLYRDGQFGPHYLEALFLLEENLTEHSDGIPFAKVDDLKILFDRGR